ncbi:MAG: hypothetical protein QOH46_4133 [Solirubrobacteraceae bacterium]|nr:hypothetical protein [Solirubrobacteraceae bacterium]
MAAAASPLHANFPVGWRLRSESADRDLARRVRGGDQSAFEVIYQRYHRGLLAFCVHMLGSRDEAEDALQHVFASAYQGLLSSSRDIELRPWLYTIARNRCLSALRARRHDLAVDGLDRAGTPPDCLAAEVQRKAELREVLDDLRRLPQDQREALVLFEFGDCSHEEIASVLGVRRAKVKALIFQARERLMRARDARHTACGDIRAQIANLEGRAPRGAVRHHLDGCAGCAAFSVEVRRRRRLLGLVFPFVPSLGVKASILGIVREGGNVGPGRGVAGSAIGAGGVAVGGAGASGSGTAGIAGVVTGSAVACGVGGADGGATAIVAALGAKAIVAKTVAVVAVSAGAAAGASLQADRPAMTVPWASLQSPDPGRTVPAPGPPAGHRSPAPVEHGGASLPVPRAILGTRRATGPSAGAGPKPVVHINPPWGAVPLPHITAVPGVRARLVAPESPPAALGCRALVLPTGGSMGTAAAPGGATAVNDCSGPSIAAPRVAPPYFTSDPAADRAGGPEPKSVAGLGPFGDSRDGAASEIALPPPTGAKPRNLPVPAAAAESGAVPTRKRGGGTPKRPGERIAAGRSEPPGTTPSRRPGARDPGDWAGGGPSTAPSWRARPSDPVVTRATSPPASPGRSTSSHGGGKRGNADAGDAIAPREASSSPASASRDATPRSDGHRAFGVRAAPCDDCAAHRRRSAATVDRAPAATVAATETAPPPEPAPPPAPAASSPAQAVPAEPSGAPGSPPAKTATDASPSVAAVAAAPGPASAPATTPHGAAAAGVPEADQPPSEP